MLDGVGKDIGFAFAILLGVLLAADDDGLGAVAFVDAVYHLVELPELLDVFGIEVKEILLQRAVGGDAEDDDTSPFVEVALVVDAFQHLLRRLHDVDGGTAWRDKPLFPRRRLPPCPAFSVSRHSGWHSSTHGYSGCRGRQSSH